MNNNLQHENRRRDGEKPVRDAFEQKIIDFILVFVALSVIWTGYEKNWDLLLYVSIALTITAIIHRASRWKESNNDRMESDIFIKQNRIFMIIVLICFIANFIAFSNPIFRFNPDSSAIKHVWYDRRAKVLGITFQPSESDYCFYDVPYDVYKKFSESPSAGRYFNQYIRKRYRYENTTGLDIYDQ